jgi:hypothetical protein
MIMRFPNQVLRKMFMNTYADGFYMGGASVITVCLIGSVIKHTPPPLKKLILPPLLN